MVWAVGISPGARVIQIGGPADWVRLAAGFPRDVTASRHDDWDGWTLLTGWEADHTLWLNDVFTAVERVASWRGSPGRRPCPGPRRRGSPRAAGTGPAASRREEAHDQHYLERMSGPDSEPAAG